MTSFKKTYSLLESKRRIEHFCAYQERCEQEVIKKLASFGIYGEQADVLVADLISNNFLNEERFAEAFASGKFRIKQWGKTKIKQGLKQKNISDYSTNRALKLIDEQEYRTTIDELIERKWNEYVTNNDYERQIKVSRFLISRGFEYALISEHIEAFKQK